jgi:gluconolactonase
VVIADHEAKKLNAERPIDRKGRIWFTNPVNDGNWDKTEREELDHRSVLRADPQKDGSYTVTRVTFDTTQPNGILVSRDQNTLMSPKADLPRASARTAVPTRYVMTAVLGTTLFTWGEDARGVHRGIDGMCFDCDGNIVATAGYEQSGSGPMIYVFSPTGRVLETHPLPSVRPTNCCFGGADRRSSSPPGKATSSRHRRIA